MTDTPNTQQPPESGGSESTQLLSQIVDQYRVIDYLGGVMADLARAHIHMLQRQDVELTKGRASTYGGISAHWMAQLADMLNNVDACDEESDRWTYPIIERAQKMFPESR